ncbi:hypothetical protein H0H92_014749 [Tricholoma furcatifolium]|nr:hypothetical protein H0H92_014749 [Tricholoma furcatifolium]
MFLDSSQNSRLAMSTYHLFEIPQPASDAHTYQYSVIRLLGLQTDAHAFGSTYNRESEFTVQQWHERLDTPGRTTFIACAGSTSEENENWVGTAGLLAPKMWKALDWNPPEHLIAEDEALFILVGMWVHPDHRRQELGKRLIDAVWRKLGDDMEETKRKVLMLEVGKNNVEAKALYGHVGFQSCGLDGEEEEIWMRLDR